MRHVDKKNELKYCFNSVLYMKMKQREKKFAYGSTINAAMRGVRKSNRQRYWLYFILNIKMKDGKTISLFAETQEAK